jgi:hypothetical protein
MLAGALPRKGRALVLGSAHVVVVFVLKNGQVPEGASKLSLHFWSKSGGKV